MELTDFEVQVVEEFLKRTTATVAKRKDLLENILVSSRNETGAGFFTTLKQVQVLKVAEESKSFKWGEIGARLNGNVDIGFLLDIKDGCLVCLEGYTYSDVWPNEIVEVVFYGI